MNISNVTISKTAGGELFLSIKIKRKTAPMSEINNELKRLPFSAYIYGHEELSTTIGVILPFGVDLVTVNEIVDNVVALYDIVCIKLQTISDLNNRINAIAKDITVFYEKRKPTSSTSSETQNIGSRGKRSSEIVDEKK